jgi:pyruvate formate lyase activating enzyme
MRQVSRREFIKGLAGLGLCTLGGGALVSGLSCAMREETTEVSSAGLASAVSSPHVREAMYYTGVEEGLDCTACHGATEPSRVLYCHTSHAGDHVKCQLCPRECIISEGHRGECRVRENRGGKLYSMVYGNPCAVHVDPIEKKPFNHFLPTTLAFSIATAGCNLHCLYCQNWQISQVPPEETDNVDLPPEKVVEWALKTDCRSIAYTYSEPTVFYEYMLDSARLARPAGVRNVVITNGYLNPAPLRELCRAVDALRIDFKGFNEEFYQEVCSGTLSPVLEAMKTIYEEGVHLEIPILVVPTLNDDEDEIREMCRWIMDNLGPDVPVHFNRFTPMYKLQNLPSTPVETLERAREIGTEEGINYIYIGNVPGHLANNTYCAHCGKLIIGRRGFYVTAYHLVEGKCEYCGSPIPGVWE